MFTDKGPLGERVFLSADVARLAGISLRCRLEAPYDRLGDPQLARRIGSITQSQNRGVQQNQEPVPDRLIRVCRNRMGRPLRRVPVVNWKCAAMAVSLPAIGGRAHLTGR